jgi:L-ascorbate metabolism protein UlaG (beta-lactamase superfamily)
MEITHLGHSSFKLKGKSASLITDPFDPEAVGMKFPKAEADVVTLSHFHKDHNFTEGIGGEPVIIAGPGEYEVKGIRVIGIPSYHDAEKGAEKGKNTMYLIVIDNVSIVHCGDLGHKLDDKQKEILNGADILLIPVGGFFTINAKTATEVVSQIEPSVIIPMHYRTDKFTKEVSSEFVGVEEFLKEMGKEAVLSQPKLMITKDKIPGEPTVVVLE